MCGFEAGSFLGMRAEIDTIMEQDLWRQLQRRNFYSASPKHAGTWRQWWHWFSRTGFNSGYLFKSTHCKGWRLPLRSSLIIWKLLSGRWPGHRYGMFFRVRGEPVVTGRTQKKMDISFYSTYVLCLIKLVMPLTLCNSAFWPTEKSN